MPAPEREGGQVKEGEKGGTRKVGEVPVPCLHGEHEPPRNLLLLPGRYEHECPGCGKVSSFEVKRITC